MGTRSTIAYKEGNKIRSVYCHWDGYLDHNGKILLNHYQDRSKVQQLIELGDLSSLDAEIDDCVFYGRDRCEHGVEAREFDTVQDWLAHYDWSEYAYLWLDGEWLVWQGERDALEQPVFRRLDSDLLETVEV